MNIFNREARQAFEKRLAQYLRDRYGQTPVPAAAGDVPLSELPPAVLERMVAFGLRKADQYGLRAQAQLAGFVALMFLAGPNFDEQPEVQAELKEPTVPDCSRMDHVCAAVPQSVWHAIRSSYNAASWGEAVRSPT